MHLFTSCLAHLAFVKKNWNRLFFKQCLGAGQEAENSCCAIVCLIYT